jgi:hypothetical protein
MTQGARGDRPQQAARGTEANRARTGPSSMQRGACTLHGCPMGCRAPSRMGPGWACRPWRMLQLPLGGLGLNLRGWGTGLHGSWTSMSHAGAGAAHAARACARARTARACPKTLVWCGCCLGYLGCLSVGPTLGPLLGLGIRAQDGQGHGACMSGLHCCRACWLLIVGRAEGSMVAVCTQCLAVLPCECGGQGAGAVGRRGGDRWAPGRGHVATGAKRTMFLYPAQTRG